MQRNFTPTFYSLSVKITENFALFLEKFCFEQYANILVTSQCIVSFLCGMVFSYSIYDKYLKVALTYSKAEFVC